MNADSGPNPGPAHIARWARIRPDHPAVVEWRSGRRLTYGELLAQSRVLADTLLDLDLARSPIGVVTGDALTRAVAELGIKLAGAVFAPVAPDLAADELVGLLRFLEVRGIIGAVPADITERVPTCAAGLSGSMSVVVRRPDAVHPSYTIPAHWARFSGTSGTTARPKVVVHTTSSLMAHDPDWAGIGPDDVLISALAPSHGIMMRRMLNGGGTYITAYGRDPAAVAESVGASGATIVLGIPWMFRQWAGQSSIHPLLRGLRFGISPGPLPHSAVQALYDATGCIAANAYGTSETGAAMIPVLSWVDGKIDTIGRIRPQLRARLVADGRDVDEGEPGELWLSGPGVMEGYLKDPGLTAAVMQDGWFRTGDVMTRDADGYYRIVGRLKSMIRVAGRNVYPEEVEMVLLAHPAVAQALVLPAADSIRGERVEAAVVLSPGHAVAGHELRAYCRTKLAAYKVPRMVRFVPSLATTRFGRVSRQHPRPEDPL